LASFFVLGCVRVPEISLESRATEVEPARLLPVQGGYVLVGTRYHKGPKPYGEVFFELLSTAGFRIKRPSVVATSPDSAGMVEVERVPTGYVVAHTPGPVGGRYVRTFHVAERFGEFVSRPAFLVVEPPGNPYFLGLARSHGELVLLHSGNDAADGLFLSTLSTQGKPLTRWAVPGTTFRSTAVDVIPTLDGFAALCRHDEEGARHAMIDTFDRDGAPGVRHKLKVDGVFEAARLGATTEVVFQDNTGGLPGERMGLQLAQFQGGQWELEPLGAQDEKEPCFGTAAWSGDRLGAAFQGPDGTQLWFAIDRGPPVQLSNRYAGTVALHADDQGFYLAWEELGDEPHIAVFNAQGQPVVPPGPTH
jgi:hypothetical protein